MRITRDVGDNYPIDVTMKVNGVAIDISGSSLLFIYSRGSSEYIINGTIVSAVEGKARFSPSTSDFSSTGTFKYKIKRVYDGITTTHLKGDLIIE